MSTSKLSPEYLRALMEGTQTFHQHEGRSFSHIDEIVFAGGTLEFRWRGQRIITHDLAWIIAMSRAAPVSIGMEVKLE